MYRSKTVEDALLHVVGWEQDIDPTLQVAGGLTQSTSGLTFQAAHPMCTLGMVNALVPTEWDRNIAAWSATDTVRKGELRKHGGYYWKAKKESVGQEPPSADFNGDFNEDYGNQWWRATTLLSEKAEQLTRRGVQNAVELEKMGVLDTGRQQGGSGASGSAGGQGAGVQLDLGAARTRVEADEIIERQLMSQGHAKSDSDWQALKDKAWDDNKERLANLPLR